MGYYNLNRRLFISQDPFNNVQKILCLRAICCSNIMVEQQGDYPEIMGLSRNNGKHYRYWIM